MKFFSKEDRKSVIISLVASVLFLLVLEPIIYIAKDVASKGMTAFIDYFYYSCGRADNGTFLNTMALYAFIVFMCTSVFYIIKSAFPAKKKTKAQQ